MLDTLFSQHDMHFEGYPRPNDLTFDNLMHHSTKCSTIFKNYRASDTRVDKIHFFVINDDQSRSIAVTKHKLTLTFSLDAL